MPRLVASSRSRARDWSSGTAARLAAADSGAEAEAEADRRALIDAKGDDANDSETKVELIRKRYGGEATPS